MSRVGKKPIKIPDKTKITYSNRLLVVEGAKGKLSHAVHAAVDLAIQDGVMNVTLQNDNRPVKLRPL